MTNNFMHNKVKQISLKKGMSADDLVRQMEASGVMGAGRIAKAANIAEEMISNKDTKVFFGFAGAMVPGGMKQIVIDMLKKGWIDVFVTTGANMTHDLVEALGYNHFQGHSDVDDKELNEKKIDRIYESFMPNEVYEGLEDFFEKNFDKIKGDGEPMNVREFLWRIGELIPCENSILKICAKNKIPIFCPAIADSGIGLMIWGQLAKNKKLQVDAFDDLKDIIGEAWDDNSRFGVWYIGGGVPKNYIQQAMQFCPKAAEFGIQITMDRPEPGGSSGAELREGISWGKMNKQGKYVDVICDATIALPLIAAAITERLEK